MACIFPWWNVPYEGRCDGNVCKFEDICPVQGNAHRPHGDFKPIGVGDENRVAVEAQVSETGFVCAVDDSYELFQQPECLPWVERSVDIKVRAQGHALRGNVIGDDKTMPFRGTKIEDAQDMCVSDGSVF